MTADPRQVDEIRRISRALVRELGFMGGDFAGTDLSPSAVHALIEIEADDLTASELGQRLRLEKSSVSRMLRKLLDAGDIDTAASASDGRIKRLALTAAGRKRLAAIHAFARSQVAQALERLETDQGRTVLEGLRLYASALGAPTDGQATAADIRIVRGYRPGLIARITEMHALYYARESGLGQRFESVVAAGLADFCNRLESPCNAIWTACRADGRCVGSVAIDGEDLGGNVAHLRWFILTDGLRGAGIGKRLLDTALAFCDERGFDETRLWTFSGLDAARHLYETRGFALAQQQPGTQWGKQVLEQVFVRGRP